MKLELKPSSTKQVVIAGFTVVVIVMLYLGNAQRKRDEDAAFQARTESEMQVIRDANRAQEHYEDSKRVSKYLGN